MKGEVPGSVHAEHQQIFKAAMARDADRVDKALGKHIQFALSVIRSQGLLT